MESAIQCVYMRLANLFHANKMTLSYVHPQSSVYGQMEMRSDPRSSQHSELKDIVISIISKTTYFQYFPTSVQGPSHMPPLDAWMPDGAASLDSVFAMYGAWVSARDESDE